ncbi:hypothetical protein GCM10020000_52360 [Streptomyces olivoverticillatus]
MGSPFPKAASGGGGWHTPHSADRPPPDNAPSPPRPALLPRGPRKPLTTAMRRPLHRAAAPTRPPARPHLVISLPWPPAVLGVERGAAAARHRPNLDGCRKES